MINVLKKMKVTNLKVVENRGARKRITEEAETFKFELVPYDDGESILCLK